MLPKWPGFLVAGEPVTKEQAAEIIIRTGPYMFSSNDKTFLKTLYKLIDVPTDQYGDPDYKGDYRVCPLAKVHERYGRLDLEYLTNSRVVSAWVGGPNGWIDWDGEVGTRNSNIGKWPDVETVEAEWKRIAEAFPYLDLRCQLLADEIYGFDSDMNRGTARPLIEFEVYGGKVTTTEDPETILCHPEPGNMAIDMLWVFTKKNRERGCTPEQFTETLEITEKSLQKSLTPDRRSP